MFPLNYPLAAAALMGGGDVPDVQPLPVKELRQEMKQEKEIANNLDAIASTTRIPLRNLCLYWEILDPREVRYVLTRPEDFPSDLKLLRRRYADLKDAPPLSDCMRFPDRSLVNDMLAFNRVYRQHLTNRQALERDNAWELREMILETDRLYAIWDLARDARCDYYYVTVRRQALKKIKEEIGDQAFYSGYLPPHVPVWQFERIDK
jgi:hypothetical protein